MCIRDSHHKVTLPSRLDTELARKIFDKAIEEGYIIIEMCIRDRDWPIRLYKCASSLLLFGFEKEFESVRMYALHLISEEKNFWYDGKDC